MRDTIDESTLNTLCYFFTEGSVTSWVEWEGNKEIFLQAMPLLKMYLEKERELEVLGIAVVKEIEQATDALRVD